LPEQYVTEISSMYNFYFLSYKDLLPCEEYK